MRRGGMTVEAVDVSGVALTAFALSAIVKEYNDEVDKMLDTTCDCGVQRSSSAKTVDIRKEKEERRKEEEEESEPKYLCDYGIVYIFILCFFEVNVRF